MLYISDADNDAAYTWNDLGGRSRSLAVSQFNKPHVTLY